MGHGSARSNGKHAGRQVLALALRSRTSPSIGLRVHASIGKDRTKFVSPELFQGTGVDRGWGPAKSGTGFAVLTTRNDSRTAAVSVNEETAE